MTQDDPTDEEILECVPETLEEAKENDMWVDNLYRYIIDKLGWSKSKRAFHRRFKKIEKSSISLEVVGKKRYYYRNDIKKPESDGIDINTHEIQEESPEIYNWPANNNYFENQIKGREKEIEEVCRKITERWVLSRYEWILTKLNEFEKESDENHQLYILDGIERYINRHCKDGYKADGIIEKIEEIISHKEYSIDVQIYLVSLYGTVLKSPADNKDTVWLEDNIGAIESKILGIYDLVSDPIEVDCTYWVVKVMQVLIKNYYLARDVEIPNQILDLLIEKYMIPERESMIFDFFNHSISTDPSKRKYIKEKLLGIIKNKEIDADTEKRIWRLLKTDAYMFI